MSIFSAHVSLCLQTNTTSNHTSHRQVSYQFILFTRSKTLTNKTSSWRVIITIWFAAQEESSLKYLPICVEEVQCQLHVNRTLHSAEVFVWLQGQGSIGLWGYTVFCKEEHEIKRKWQVQWFGQPQKKYSTSVNFNCKSTWQRLNTSLFLSFFSLYYVHNIKQQKNKHLSGTSYLSKKKKKKKRQHTNLIYQTSTIGKVCSQYKENITQHFFYWDPLDVSLVHLFQL